MRKFLTLFFIVAGIGGAYVAWQAISFLNSSPHAEHQEIVFEIPNGKAFKFVARDLETRGIITSAFKFRILAKLTGEAGRVKVGEYQLFTDMKPAEILGILNSGKSIAYALVVPEGQNIYDIKDSLNKLWPGRGDEFLKIVTDSARVQKWTGYRLRSLEGFLYPETYSITKYTSNETIARQMFDKFQVMLKIANENAKLRMSPRDQVILASVIEKETGKPEDRPLISSVFHNRLAQKVRLQSDPTILYGMLVENNGVTPTNIRKDDIAHNTPYNTYTVPGLPIGPIANPGLDSLRAAVNPAGTKYMFFVSRNDGTSSFAETLQQHNKAVTKFQVNPKARAGKSWRDLKKKAQAKTNSN